MTRYLYAPEMSPGHHVKHIEEDEKGEKKKRKKKDDKTSDSLYSQMQGKYQGNKQEPKCTTPGVIIQSVAQCRASLSLLMGASELLQAHKPRQRMDNSRPV